MVDQYGLFTCRIVCSSFLIESITGLIRGFNLTGSSFSAIRLQAVLDCTLVNNDSKYGQNGYKVKYKLS
jgi:hypothetical protein